MALRLMRQLDVIKLKLVGKGVRCCRGVFWEKTHYSLCVAGQASKGKGK